LNTGAQKSTALLSAAFAALALLFAAPWAIAAESAITTAPSLRAWPAANLEARPWTYWWWMGSAVDQTNITRELRRYKDAGLGGVHIIPIYGAHGFEDKFIEYLSPKWMEMLRYTVSEAAKLDMGVDMTTGSGWCFGGPHVTAQEANASVIARMFNVASGDTVKEKLDPAATQALMAFSGSGTPLDLRERIRPDGSVDWIAPSGSWRVYAISQKPSGQQVKRAGPGGQGPMLNLFYARAMSNYLAWFDSAFAGYQGPKPRAMYHDSYEYRSDWAPDLFAQFQQRRGYDLRNELPALFGRPSSNDEKDRAARVKSDYRETLSNIMAEDTLSLWARWSSTHGFLTRNEAHGSPGNLLDLYAVADIPETEMFYRDRNKLICKFASSAAHVTGKPLVSAETGTWLKEHFTETLADVKYLFDDMFLSGINHIFYHGTCYSPNEAGWPGWHFYASLEMNPRNSIWRDVKAVNEYATRVQSVLQSGLPDNDILLYWPIHDYWHNSSGLVQQFTVHARDWFENQPIGRVADHLWQRGYAFDYVSDRQIQQSDLPDPGNKSFVRPDPVVVVPECQRVPVDTFQSLLARARRGTTVIFQNQLPNDVPGVGQLEQRRAELKKLLGGIQLEPVDKESKLKVFALGNGRVLVGDLEAALTIARVPREAMFDQPGLMCIRRVLPDGTWYFVANRSEYNQVNGWIPLARKADSVVVLDPMTGDSGVGVVRKNANEQTEVYLQLEPGASIILHCSAERRLAGPVWPSWEPSTAPSTVSGEWKVEFLEGGPELPSAFATKSLPSWTELPDTNAVRFAGTAKYSITFDAPSPDTNYWLLDLGKVCQSARVRLNGVDQGIWVISPFRKVVGGLKPKGNILEVEVTNVSANRIRDLDRRGVKWKTFYDINIVNLDYKPFDASNWPLTESGLLGPVTLAPVRELPDIRR
jgi:hypothetical protein